ncbi:uncharacterized protein V1516DRAFT_676006 [Lipomyces oligophaga]|uniref:uncharacterized protein n=1 Tax=Lipomyces oligophaga TaxID=45792 RepID=UPI0034CE1FAA
MGMKKLLGRGRSTNDRGGSSNHPVVNGNGYGNGPVSGNPYERSPSPQPSEQEEPNYNPYAQSMDYIQQRQMDGKPNPYAIGSSSFNSVPPSRPLASRSNSYGRSDQAVLSNPYESSGPVYNPYDLQSAVSRNKNDSYVSNRSPYGAPPQVDTTSQYNPYDISSKASSAASARQDPYTQSSYQSKSTLSVNRSATLSTASQKNAYNNPYTAVSAPANGNPYSAEGSPRKGPYSRQNEQVNVNSSYSSLPSYRTNAESNNLNRESYPDSYADSAYGDRGYSSTISDRGPYSGGDGSTSSASLATTMNAPQEKEYAESVAEARQELFKGVRNRFKVRGAETSVQLPEASSTYDPSIMETESERLAREGPDNASVYGGTSEVYGGSTYDSEAARQEEEAEVSQIKEQMKYIKQESLSSAMNARRYAEEAEASGLRTLQMLGEQSDRIANSEAAIAVTENQTKLGEDYARELETLNRSMFAVHVSNPFSSRRRLQQQELKIRDTFHNQQVQREENRRNQYEAQQRIGSAMGNIPGQRRRQLAEAELRYREQMQKQKASLAEQSRFQFEADEEDFAVERDIDSTLDDVSAATTRLNLMAKSVNKELSLQNERLQKLNSKTQEVEIGVHLNSSRLARIR